MKNVTIMMLMLAMTTLFGCQWNSPRGGSLVEGKGFTISVPNYVTEIKQGEVKNVTVTLERGKYFRHDVRLKLESPKGIQIEPSSITVSSSDKPEVQITISSDRTSALGEYRVGVTGTPEEGEPTTTVFNVRVVTP